MSTRRRLVVACAALAIAMLGIAGSCGSPIRQYYTPCDTVADCFNPPDPECGQLSCTKGKCARNLFEYTRGQFPGSCSTVVCDSNGYTALIAAPDDVWDDGNPCTKDFCDEIEIRNSWLELGPSPGGSGFCDGRGHVVECVSDANCNDSSLFCARSNRCLPRECDNDRLDLSVGETSADCGGLCDPCETGLPCNSSGDCVEGVCGADKTCSAATCADGVRNGEESDIDCGDACGRCPDGAKCRAHQGCENLVCFGGACQPASCRDGIQNGGEADTDCGGNCFPCP